MSEKHFVFIKNNRVEQVAVFSEQNQELADLIVSEQGFDSALWIGEDQPPQRWSSYDGKKFTPPTDEYLISIGVLDTFTESAAEVDVEIPTE